MDFTEVLNSQRAFFNTGATRSLTYRLEMLQKLYDSIQKNESLINEAMKTDLNKCATEVYMTETGLVLDEISYHRKHLAHWVKDKKVLQTL